LVANPNNPYLIRRTVQEAAFKSLNICPRQVIGGKFGQMWQAEDGQGDGPSFVLQWFGDHQEYFDQQQVTKALSDVAEWRVRNPMLSH
jgi:hypothetical protein